MSNNEPTLQEIIDIVDDLNFDSVSEEANDDYGFTFSVGYSSGGTVIGYAGNVIFDDDCDEREEVNDDKEDLKEFLIKTVAKHTAWAHPSLESNK